MINTFDRFRVLLAGPILLAALLCHSAALAQSPSSRVDPIEVWYTFAVDSQEEAIFLRAVDAFEKAHPDIPVKPTRIPYLQNLSQFINSSQAGEAPDVIRLSDSELGRVGHISVEGLPLLEDLRVHLTPMQRSRFDARALAAMRYGNPLYAIPVSQGCLSLIYNRKLFDQAGVAYPRDDWTTEELLRAARSLTRGDILGMSVPLKWSYWFVPVLSAFGGAMFDPSGRPTLDSPGSSEAMDWYLDLERVHGVTVSSTSLEAMSTQFLLEKSAMVFDGAWNWNTYANQGLDIGQAVMPVMAETGQRLAPLASYFGWAVSKQSDAKVDSVRLALWLTSADVQKEFALSTYMLPTDRSLARDPEIAADPVLAGYIRQIQHTVQVPTVRGASMVYEQLDVALEMTYTGEMTAADALAAADVEMERVLDR